MPSLDAILGGISVLDGDNHGLPEKEANELLDRYLADDLPDKVDGYGRVMAEMASTDAVITDEINRLKARRTAVRNARDRMKERLLAAMEFHGHKRLNGKLHSATVQRTTPTVEVHDEYALAAEMPDLMVDVPATKKPNKPLIAKYLKQGVALPGCSLLENTTVRIR